MEVHHHSQHGGRKNWKTYFWEFMMLFLAVYCGFLAENWREHIVEHNREKQYLRSLILDTRIDIASIHKLDSIYIRLLQHIDTLQKYLSGKEIINNSFPAYLEWERSFTFPDFVATDGTIKQLLSTGSLRLISKKNVVDSIMAYERELERVTIHQQLMNTKLTQYGEEYELFNAVAIGSGTPSVEILLLSADKKLLSIAYGKAENWRYDVLGLRITVQNIQARGEGLLKAIKTEYNIE